MQKKSSKIVFIVLTILLAAMLTACAAPIALPTGDYNQVYNAEVPVLNVGAEGQFKILQLTDIHLYGNTNKYDKKTLGAIDNLLHKNSYDLVVVTGDLLEGHTKKKYDKQSALTAFAGMMDEHKQYWCFVAGNNDGEFCGSNEDIFYNLSKFEYCIVADTKNVGGTGNYSIPIFNSANKEVHRLIMLDSRMRDKNGKLLNIDESQIDWYKSVATECAANNVKNSLFMHIPVESYSAAYNNGEVVNTYNNYAKYTTIDNGNDNSAFCNALKLDSSNALVASGHTHNNSYARFYDNRYWVSVAAGGYNAGKDKKVVVGGAEITIHTNASDTKSMYTITTKEY